MYRYSDSKEGPINICWKPGFSDNFDSRYSSYKGYDSPGIHTKVIKVRSGDRKDEGKLLVFLSQFLNLAKGDEWFEDNTDYNVPELFSQPWEVIDKFLLDNLDNPNLLEIIKHTNIKKQIILELEKLPKEKSTTINTEVDVTPNVCYLDTIKRSGYTVLTALEDIIDNSLEKTVGARNVSIKFTPSLADPRVMSYFQIIDDGIGMDSDTLIEAFKLGSRTGKNRNSDFGYYGTGLKSAGLFLGNKITIYTKASTGNFYIATFDKDYMIKTNKFSISIREGNISEFLSFKKEVKSDHGTIVLIENVDSNNLIDNISKFQQQLKKKLGITYFKLFTTSKVTIKINNDLVTPIDPLCRDIKGVEILSKPGSHIKYKDKIINYTCVYIKKELTSLEVNRNRKNSGFWIFRNGRLVGSGLKLGIINDSNNELSGFRIEISTDGDVTDTCFNSTYLKTIKESERDDINPELIEILKEDLGKYVHEAGKRSKQEKTSKELDERASKDIKMIENQINSNTLFSKKKDKLVELNTFSGGKCGSIFESSLNKGEYKISLNTDHNFWIDFLSSSQIETKQIIIELFTSMCMGIDKVDYECPEEKYNMFEEFIIELSNIMRKFIK